MALVVLGSAAATLLSAVLFCVCAFHLEAWGPPPLLLGAGVGLVGVLVGGVTSLGGLLQLLAHVAETDEDTPLLSVFTDRIGLQGPETQDMGV
ncbi:hypothetical protein ACM64Y_14230 [Novispirillum sp. DQ9]|uniref:hypothetical protein n=1 Tax=Novispirillum sp. DQ9 TaxID=3398612 RepID=UPI003C7BCC35